MQLGLRPVTHPIRSRIRIRTQSQPTPGFLFLATPLMSCPCFACPLGVKLERLETPVRIPSPSFSSHVMWGKLIHMSRSYLCHRIIMVSPSLVDVKFKRDNVVKTPGTEYTVNAFFECMIYSSPQTQPQRKHSGPVLGPSLLLPGPAPCRPLQDLDTHCSLAEPAAGAGGIGGAASSPR